MNLKIILDFLIDLKFNNNRNWFNENKDQYLAAKLEYEKFIELLIPEIKKFDKDINVSLAKECVFRIYRDVRFSKNKEPYKINFGASIAKGGRKSPNAGYYIHFEPDNSFIGGGIYQPDSKTIKSIRTAIVNDSEKYKSIINKPSFKKVFPEIYGEQLKSAPRGFSKDLECIDLIKNKHYVVTKNIDNSFWLKDNVIEEIAKILKVQYEFNQFLNDNIDK